MTLNFHADATKVAIWEGDTDAPLNDPLNNLDFIRLHSDIDYIRVLASGTVHHSFPDLAVQGANQDPVFVQNTSLVAHGQPRPPMIFAVTTVGGIKVPFRGSIVLQRGGSNGTLFRSATIGVNATHIVLNEYTIRSAQTPYAGFSLPITYYVTDEPTDG